MRKTGSPLPSNRKLLRETVPVVPAALGEDSTDLEAFRGWVKTWVWTLAGLFVYAVARWVVDICIPADPLASVELFRQVPLLVYQMSSTAFFTALVLNLTSLLFEDNATKRQLALLSCAIKGAACHTDMLLVTGHAHVVFDGFGAIVIPHRYVQWMVTTPTMVYILSKISDFTPLQTAIAIGMDVAMIVFGLIANFVPGPYNWLLFCLSMFSFMGVLYMMGKMVYSAVKEHTNATSRRSLLFIYMCTLLIWNMFPLAWVLHVLNPNAPFGEYLNVFANFMAKVLFSSSIMYGNYMTIAQRRLLAQQAAENEHRVRMIQELRDAVTRKDQFMSLMSHELRTPLNGIIQLSDALVRGAGGEMNPKGQHFVKTIKNSSNHLLNIINDILDVAALKEGKLTIKHELCSLAKAVDHVVDIVAPLARKDVVIERSVDPRTPLIIADFSRVIQILYNLAGNALKFTHRGRVCVRVAPAANGSFVTLQVADTGIGIPADRIAGIWGAFEQVDMSVTRKYGGTGLGLNIVKQLVEAHDGQIEVQSAEGRGTTFTVTLPVLQPNTRQSLEVQVEDSLAKCGHLAAKQVVAKKRVKRLASVSGKTQDLEDSLSQLTRGESRLGSGLMSPKKNVQDGGNLGTSNVQDKEDVLYRRRTQELERENLMGELQRRTEHKRSMEESQLASRQLELSEPERQAERDSRSLERLEMHIVERSGRSGRSAGAPAPRGPGSGTLPTSSGRVGSMFPPSCGAEDGALRNRSETGMACARAFGGGGVAGGGSGSAYQAWRGDPETATRPVVGRRSLTAADAREAIAAAPNTRASAGGAGGVSTLTTHTYMADAYDHLIIARASTDSHSSNTTLVRKLSATSISGSKPSTVRDALRMSTYGRGSAAATGSNGCGNPGGHAQSGPVPATTSHLLLKSALDSELYKAARESYDDGCSSVGADSESEGHRGSRRPHKGPPSRTSKLVTSGSLAVANNSAASAAAPPPGLTLDKLAYSDMYGTVQVLSVDDEEVNQIVLEEILTSSGYHFARCMDGLEALEWLCASETMPDLILLDCMMPNMSGHEFCTTLRKIIPGNVLPVIMVSAKSDEDNIVEGLRSGSNDFVRKPYQREELLARIETQLRLKSDSWWLAELVNNVDGRETESMKLLKNILPESIIARMQQGQKFVADSHAHVVILFSDIVGFTSLSSKLPTAEVFLMLSNMFTAFDKLTDRFSVYKVETIGDAYMVAAGHDEDEDKGRKGSPLMRVLGFAKAMLDVVRNITAPNGERMRIRIGVHCGPAFAGVIGMKCPRYCFLGDTVNTASRMESTGFPMCIHVSEDVYRHHPSPEVDLHEVGEREVKGKGRMRTYLVRIGAWEQALRDHAARQQAAAVAAAQQQQQLAVIKQWEQERQFANGGSGGSEANGGGGGDGGARADRGGGGGALTLPPIRVAALGGGSRSAGQLTLSPANSDGANTGRFVHLLSTVTEETSLPSSPPVTAAASATAVVAAPGSPSLALRAPAAPDHLTGVVGSLGSTGVYMRQSSSSTTGIRSPLSRPELSGSRLVPRSTFGSEAFYCDESSEEGPSSTLNGMITASGMLRSRSGSLSGLPMAPPLPAGMGNGGGGHRRQYQGADRGGASGSGVTAIVTSATNAGELANAGSSGGGGGSFVAVRGPGVGLDIATVGAAAEAEHDVSHDNGLIRLRSSVAADGGGAADVKYVEQLFGARVLSPGSAGLKAGALPSTIDYLEQRIASLGTQLATEVAKRQRLQTEVDAERRRAATALQQASLLRQQMAAMTAVAVTSAAEAGGLDPATNSGSVGGCRDSGDLADVAVGSPWGQAEQPSHANQHNSSVPKHDQQQRHHCDRSEQQMYHIASTAPSGVTDGSTGPGAGAESVHQQQAQPEHGAPQQSEQKHQLQQHERLRNDSRQSRRGSLGAAQQAAAAPPPPRRALSLSQFESSESPDVEVVILGPADDDDGPGMAAAGSDHDANPLPAPIPVALLPHFPMLLPATKPADEPPLDSAPAEGQELPRDASLRGSLPSAPAGPGPVAAGAAAAEATCGISSDVLGSPFTLATSPWPNGRTVPAAERLGPQPPSGISPRVAESDLSVGSAADAAGRVAAGGPAAAAVVVAPSDGPAAAGGNFASGLRRPSPLLHSSANSFKPAATIGGGKVLLGLGGGGGAAVSSRGLFGVGLNVAIAATTSAAPGGAGVGWLMPCYSMDLLFEELGLLPYLGRFQEEAIRLDQLLGMDVSQLELLGLRPLGYCMRLREAVLELARSLLRACEEAATLAQPQLAGEAAAATGRAQTGTFVQVC